MESKVSNIVQTQINTDLTRTFTRITVDGWANASDGNVEAPTGWFACVNIEPAELGELARACELPDLPDFPMPYPGHYLYEVDSDGNRTITEFLSKHALLEAYNFKRREFARWDAEDCEECGKSDCLEPVTMDGSEKKCVACGHTFDPGLNIDEVKF